METLKKQQSGFDLPYFLTTYISAASEIAQSEPSLEEFDKGIRAHVSSNLQISEKLVVQLHHPIHWMMFNHHSGSYFELVNPRLPEDLMRVRLKKEYTPDHITDLTNLILKNYEPYLKANLNSLGLSA
jgi:hypothetical protein